MPTLTEKIEKRNLTQRREIPGLEAVKTQDLQISRRNLTQNKSSTLDLRRGCDAHTLVGIVTPLLQPGVACFADQT